jgi:hypothetical protein
MMAPIFLAIPLVITEADWQLGHWSVMNNFLYREFQMRSLRDIEPTNQAA